MAKRHLKSAARFAISDDDSGKVSGQRMLSSDKDFQLKKINTYSEEVLVE